MTASPHQPSRRLRGVAVAASAIWWALAAAWLAFALSWGALHALIVPRIEKLRPWLEQQASARLGVALRIGSLRARADSWRHLPTIEVGDLSLRNAQGEQTLHIARASATLSPRSLWRLGFEQLLIEQPRVDVVRRADGRIEVAGVALLPGEGAPSRAADWFFTQREVIVRGGALVWRDQQPAAAGGPAPAPLALDGILLVARNHGLAHDLRLEADPPAGWGGRLHAAARMRQPLITLHPGRWQDWRGQLFADFGRIDLARLAPYAGGWPGAVRLAAGTGRLRAWAGVEDGRLREATLDAALRGVVVARGQAGTRVSARESTPESTLGVAQEVPGKVPAEVPPPLALAAVSGRLSWQELPRGFALRTEGLQFSTPDGLRWSGGNASVRYQAAGAQAPAQGQVRGDALDLDTLAQVARRLPLDARLQQWLASYAPAGVVRHLEAQWRGRDAATPGGPAGAGSSSGALAGPGALFERAAWQARGRIDGLALAAGPARAAAGAVSTAGDESAAQPRPGRPGLSGAQVSFDLTQDGGSAQLSVHQGELVFPGVFEAPALPMDELQAQLVWRRQGRQHTVEVRRLAFANADAAGHASGRWQTAPAGPGGPAAPLLPGHLVLEGELTRAEGTRVHRYLPLAIPALTRQYVRDAVRAGRAARATFKVDSGLERFPPDDARQGEFRIAADLRDVDFDYVPPALAERNRQPGGWPALSGVDAQLVFDRREMLVRQASGTFDGLPQLRIAQASARIAQLGHDAPVLQVDGQVQGPLAQVLDYVRRSPLDAMAGHAFAHSHAAGESAAQLALRIPLTDAARTQVEGRVQLRDAALQFSPQTPRMEQVQGQVDFTEHGFQVSQARALMFGGELQFSGSGGQGQAPPAATASPSAAAPTPAARQALNLQFEGQGTLTAEGLRQSRELPLLAQFGRRMDGQAHYRARLGLAGGLLQAQIDSDLVGLDSRLPAPFAKAAGAALPVRFDSTLTGPAQDHIRLRVGEQVRAEFVRDIAEGYPRVSRGVIRIDAQHAAEGQLPASGVDLGVRLQTLDIGAWQQLLAAGPAPAEAQGGGGAPDAAPHGALAGAEAGAQASVPAGAQAAAPAPGGGPARADDGRAAALASFMPSRLSLEAGQLLFKGRALHNFRATGVREQQTWSADVAADELDGRLAYSQGAGDAPGRLFARFGRLALDTRAGAADAPADEGGDAVDDLLGRQPETLPALDIAVDSLRLDGRELGALRVLAANRGLRRLDGEARGTEAAAGGEGGRQDGGAGDGLGGSEGGAAAQGQGRWVHEWELRTLSLSVPEATLEASGQWRLQDAGEGRRQRETQLDFRLHTRDAGQLLDRLGFADLFRRGEGALQGRIRWRGSPLALDYPSLSGDIGIDMRSGQFLKADPGPARLLGVLSLQALPRRLVLDFRDAFSEGFAFDFIRGDARIDHGVARTNNLQMKGVSAAVLMEGQADIVRETQDLRVVVVPELNTGTMALIATAINPAVGLGTFLAQLVLKKPLLESVTRTFHLHGTWADPQVQAVKSTPQDTAAGRGVSESAKPPPAAPAGPAQDPPR